MGSNPKTSTTPRIVTGKLSKRVPSLKLSATFPVLILKEKALMSWRAPY